MNIVGLGTASHVYASVRVDVDDADHELFSEDWTSTGSKLDGVDTHSGAKSAIFDLLKDGAAHTFYFLFWADVANQATIDIVQLREGVGTCSTAAQIAVSHTQEGFSQLSVRLGVIGSGNAVWRPLTPGGAYLLGTNTTQYVAYLLLYNGSINWHFYGTVSTDLNYLHTASLVLRSEQ